MAEEIEEYDFDIDEDKLQNFLEDPNGSSNGNFPLK